MKIRIFKAAILLFSICTSDVTNAGVDTLENLEWRTKKLEDYSGISDKKFENKSKELDLKIEEYKQQKTFLDWLAIGLGSITIVSLWGFWQKAKALAEKKVNEQFEKVFEEKKDRLVTMIQNHDREHDLKCKSNICIIASHDADTDFLLKFFKDLGFSKPNLIKASDYVPIGEQVTYDILFLFREETNKMLDDELSKRYISDIRDDAVLFVFGKFIDPSGIKRRASSASFWPQLYGNLISALKFQELID